MKQVLHNMRKERSDRKQERFPKQNGPPNVKEPLNMKKDLPKTSARPRKPKAQTGDGMTHNNLNSKDRKTQIQD